jgi:hypothetical protein
VAQLVIVVGRLQQSNKQIWNSIEVYRISLQASLVSPVVLDVMLGLGSSPLLSAHKLTTNNPAARYLFQGRRKKTTEISCAILYFSDNFAPDSSVQLI